MTFQGHALCEITLIRPVARLFCGGGQIGQIWGPFMITRGLSCDRVEFGHFGGGQMTPLTPPGYGPAILGHIMLSTCSAKHLQIFTQASLCYNHPLGAKKSLAVCMKSITGMLCFPLLPKNA